MDETIGTIIKTAGDKFTELEEVLKQAEMKYTEVNSKTEYIYIEADKKFREMEEQMRRNGMGGTANNNNNNNNNHK